MFNTSLFLIIITAAGDRTHISAEQKPIFESLLRQLNQAKPRAQPAQKKMLDDVEKRLSVLFDRLNNQEVGDAACGLLLQFIGGKFVLINFNSLYSLL